MEITEIIEQPLSTLVSDHLECQKCRIVDRDTERMRGGFICPVCGYVSESGRLYFQLNIRILIDLIQESYHSINQKRQIGRQYGNEGPYDISVIIFFCALREILFNNLMIHLMEAQNIPQSVMERLLSDNKNHIQKRDKLFKSLAGVKWNEAIKKLNVKSELDYEEIDKFIKTVADARNVFVHEGIRWSIDKELSANCVKNIWGLISFYVELHNSYVHPYFNNTSEQLS